MRRLVHTAAGIVAMVALVGTVGTRSAAAQGGFSVTPWGGAYVPTNNDLEGVGGDIARDNAFAFGARLTMWGDSPIGLELTGAYSPARVTIGDETINEERDTQVFMTGLKVMFGLSPETSRVGIFLGAGPALVRRGQDVTEEEESVTDFGGVAGLGLRIPFSEAVGLRLDVEDFFYGGDFDGDDSFQNDLVLSAGIAIGW
jgi:hypothetical protein